MNTNRQNNSSVEAGSFFGFGEFVSNCVQNHTTLRESVFFPHVDRARSQLLPCEPLDRQHQEVPVESGRERARHTCERVLSPPTSTALARSCCLAASCGLSIANIRKSQSNVDGSTHDILAPFSFRIVFQSWYQRPYCTRIFRAQSLRNNVAALL